MNFTLAHWATASASHFTHVSRGLIVMLDTTNLLLTFAGLNGALACLTLWKISHEETKRGRKLAWNLSFRKPRKQTKKPTGTHSRVHATQNKKQKTVKQKLSQKGVDILPPEYNLPRKDERDGERPYLEGEWRVIE